VQICNDGLYRELVDQWGLGELGKNRRTSSPTLGKNERGGVSSPAPGEWGHRKFKTGRNVLVSRSLGKNEKSFQLEIFYCWEIDPQGVEGKKVNGGGPNGAVFQLEFQQERS